MSEFHKDHFDMSTKPTIVDKLPSSSVASSRSRKTGSRAEKLSTPVPVRRIRSTASSPLLTNTPSSYTPITAHYSLNKTLHQAFYKLCDKKRFRTALSVGIQFCRVALWDIPQHSYYDSPKYKDLKVESAQAALDISELLPIIVKKLKKENGKDNKEYYEKANEVKLLYDVSKDHYHSITNQSKYPFRKNSVKKEVIEIDDDFPSWLKVLDCGDGSMTLDNLCPPRNGRDILITIQEDEHDFNTASRRGENVNGHMERMNLLRDHPSTLPHDFSRTISAPAHLGESLASNQSSTTFEKREPPPVTLEETSNIKREGLEQRDVEIVQTKSKESLQFESDLERALYLSGLELQPSGKNTPSRIDDRSRNLKPVTDNDFVSIETLSHLYRDDFEGLRKNQVIKVSYLNTFQGRVKESVNGCTVIAPLLAIHHLCNKNQLSCRNSVLNAGNNSSSKRSEFPDEIEMFGKGIADEVVRQVIDIQAPLVLPRVRNKLGLPSGALIIPSDVHDYLIEEKYFQAEQFAGVYGGNILDDGHLSQFLDFISTFGRREGFDVDTGAAAESRKVAATFFFHEHVVSLHRVTRRVSTSFRLARKFKTPQKAGFFKKMRRKKNKNTPAIPNDEEMTTITEEETWFEIIDSLPLSTMLMNDEDLEQRNEKEWYSHLPSTARIKCNDKRSLHATLRWYACSKFTSDDQKFVDSYQWDDKNMEFDPRVFQAFVWSDEAMLQDERLTN